MRTDSLSEPEVWALGDAEVAAPAGRTIFARGDFLAPDVRDCLVDDWRLNVAPDEPPRRHALIRGWPPVGQSEIRKSLAQQLGARATLQVRPAG